MKFTIRFILPALFYLMSLSGCAMNQSSLGGFNLISVQEEQQLGEKFAGEVEKERKIVTDPVVQGYVERVGKRLEAGTRDSSFPFAFKVVDDPSVNAFAIPGGKVYVHTGLLKAVKNESELAGVMAHEMGHVVGRHGTRQMTQQYGYALLLQMVLGENPNMLAQLAASLFGKAGSLAYSRGMENQDDYLGVTTMAKAGYNPQGMVTFFSTLSSLNAAKPSQLAQFFSSHPQTPDRIEHVKEEIAKLPPGKYADGQKDELEKVKARLP